MEYTIKRMIADDLTLLETTIFFHQVFPKNRKFTLDYVRWQYARNPLGDIVAFNAWDEDKKMVSHFAAMPFNMNIYGKARRGLLCFNVATLEEHRGNKLFTKLGRRVINYAAENGFEFMIAVPNANSTHGFLKYFGFYLVSQLDVKVGFGKNIFPEKKANCYKLWDQWQWEWRMKNPSNKYCYDEKGFITSPISDHAKTLSKAFSVPPETEINSERIGFRPLNLFFGLGANTKKGLYFNLPSFVERPPFNLVFLDLTDELPILKKEDFFLQPIDMDTI